MSDDRKSYDNLPARVSKDKKSKGKDYAPARVRGAQPDDDGELARLVGADNAGDIIRADEATGYDGLGEMLVREKLISLAQLEEAAEDVKRTGDSLGSALARLGYVEEVKLVDFLSRQYGVPSVDLDGLEVPDEVVQLIPKEVAERHGLIPIDVQGSSIIVAMTDPSNIYAMDDIKFLTGYNVEAVVTTETSVRSALERYYDNVDYDDMLGGLIDEFEDVDYVSDEGNSSAINVEELEKQTELAPVVRLVNLILVDAIKRMASDIHVEPYEKEFRVRYRIDGVLYEIMKPPMRLRNAIISRLKIMSELDIAERRLPQDGRIKLVLGKQKEVDFRVSVLPCLFGEKVVLRLLDKSNLKLDMTKLGFDPGPLKLFKDAVHSPWGMVLVTGPTGSGKTTTLYSAMAELNVSTENISTAEDPVEFNLAGINQCQMNDTVGLNFSAALRSFLRQDPDIIMVGEIRDFETAEIAIKAALTGHLVLSTLHTNDAPSTVNRLLNMGVEPFLVTSALNLIVAQRLVRAVCSDCKGPDADATVEQLMGLGMTEEEANNAEVVVGSGCHNCNDTGCRGRRAVYEIMKMYDELKEAVLQGYSAMELKREAMRLGMITLRMASLTKLATGQTNVAEILRTTRAD
jgi:type IV pilus assembly protein PilB